MLTIWDFLVLALIALAVVAAITRAISEAVKKLMPSKDIPLDAMMARAAPTSEDKDDIIAEGAVANLIDGRDGVSEKLIDEKILKVILPGPWEMLCQTAQCAIRSRACGRLNRVPERGGGVNEGDTRPMKSVLVV